MSGQYIPEIYISFLQKYYKWKVIFLTVIHKRVRANDKIEPH